MIDPLDIYKTVEKIISEPLLLVLAMAAGIGYIWRVRNCPNLPVSEYLLFIKVIVIFVMIVPFYMVIWRNEYMPLVQGIAMSRSIFLALLSLMIANHIDIFLQYRKIRK